MITLALAGKPNCGKSTFFKAATMANAEIANYPFTTINPNFGVAYVRTKCACADLKVKCTHCTDGRRFVAVNLIVVAGLVPVINGSRITVLRALSGDLAGDENKPHTSHQDRVPWFDYMLIRVTRILAARGIHFPRPFIISLRNTFRRRGRLILTLFTLTMGGAIFIAVFNVRVTLHDYVGAIGSYFRADVTLDIDKANRLSEVEQYSLQVDGVKRVEGWQGLSTELLYPDGSVAENVNILAPPAESQLVNPLMAEGRWIRKDDVRKLAISEAALAYYPGLKPGDHLLL